MLCRLKELEGFKQPFKFLYYFSGGVVAVTWVAHIIMAAFLASTYESISVDYSITSQVLRQVGIVPLNTGLGNIIRLHLPDILVVLECRSLSKVYDRLRLADKSAIGMHQTDASNEQSPDRPHHSFLDVVILFAKQTFNHWVWTLAALGIVAASHPSMLTAIYEILFLIISIAVSIGNCDYPTWLKTRAFLLHYSALHMLALYCYQFDLVQRSLDNVYYIGLVKYFDVAKYASGHSEPDANLLVADGFEFAHIWALVVLFWRSAREPKSSLTVNLYKKAREKFSKTVSTFSLAAIRRKSRKSSRQSRITNANARADGASGGNPSREDGGNAAGPPLSTMSAVSVQSTASVSTKKTSPQHNTANWFVRIVDRTFHDSHVIRFLTLASGMLWAVFSPSWIGFAALIWSSLLWHFKLDYFFATLVPVTLMLASCLVVEFLFGIPGENDGAENNYISGALSTTTKHVFDMTFGVTVQSSATDEKNETQLLIKSIVFLVFCQGCHVRGIWRSNATTDNTATVAAADPGSFSNEIFSEILVPLVKHVYIVTLLVIYISSLDRVTWINLVYLLQLLVYVVSDRLRKKLWIFVIVYTNAVIVALYLYNLVLHRLNTNASRDTIRRWDIGFEETFENERYADGLKWYLIIFYTGMLQYYYVEGRQEKSKTIPASEAAYVTTAAADADAADSAVIGNLEPVIEAPMDDQGVSPNGSVAEQSGLTATDQALLPSGDAVGAAVEEAGLDAGTESVLRDQTTAPVGAAATATDTPLADVVDGATDLPKKALDGAEDLTQKAASAPISAQRSLRQSSLVDDMVDGAKDLTKKALDGAKDLTQKAASHMQSILAAIRLELKGFVKTYYSATCLVVLLSVALVNPPQFYELGYLFLGVITVDLHLLKQHNAAVRLMMIVITIYAGLVLVMKYGFQFYMVYTNVLNGEIFNVNGTFHNWRQVPVKCENYTISDEVVTRAYQCFYYDPADPWNRWFTDAGIEIVPPEQKELLKMLGVESVVLLLFILHWKFRSLRSKRSNDDTATELEECRCSKCLSLIENVEVDITRADKQKKTHPTFARQSESGWATVEARKGIKKIKAFLCLISFHIGITLAAASAVQENGVSVLGLVILLLAMIAALLPRRVAATRVALLFVLQLKIMTTLLYQPLSTRTILSLKMRSVQASYLGFVVADESAWSWQLVAYEVVAAALLVCSAKAEKWQNHFCTAWKKDWRREENVRPYAYTCQSFKTDGILGGARGILRRFGVELNTFFIVVVAFKRLNVIAVIYMLLALAIILHLHNVSGVQWAAYRSMKPQCALPSTTGRLWRFMTYLVGALLVFQYISSLGYPPSDSEEDELDRRYIADELDTTEGGVERWLYVDPVRPRTARQGYNVTLAAGGRYAWDLPRAPDSWSDPSYLMWDWVLFMLMTLQSSAFADHAFRHKHPLAKTAVAPELTTSEEGNRFYESLARCYPWFVALYAVLTCFLRTDLFLIAMLAQLARMMWNPTLTFYPGLWRRDTARSYWNVLLILNYSLLMLRVLWVLPLLNWNWEPEDLSTSAIFDTRMVDDAINLFGLRFGFGIPFREADPVCGVWESSCGSSVGYQIVLFGLILVQKHLLRTKTMKQVAFKLALVVVNATTTFEGDVFPEYVVASLKEQRKHAAPRRRAELLCGKVRRGVLGGGSVGFNASGVQSAASSNVGSLSPASMDDDEGTTVERLPQSDSQVPKARPKAHGETRGTDSITAYWFSDPRIFPARGRGFGFTTFDKNEVQSVSGSNTSTARGALRRFLKRQIQWLRLHTDSYKKLIDAGSMFGAGVAVAGMETHAQPGSRDAAPNDSDAGQVGRGQTEGLSTGSDPAGSSVTKGESAAATPSHAPLGIGDSALHADAPKGDKPKQRSLGKLFMDLLREIYYLAHVKTSWPCVILLFMVAMVHANLVSMLYPMSWLLVGQIQKPFPGFRYWQMLIVYTQAVLFSKMAFRFTIWGKFNDPGSSVDATNEFCRTGDEYQPCGQDCSNFARWFGLMRVSSSGEDPRIFGDLFLELLLLVFLSVHRHMLVRLGKWGIEQSVLHTIIVKQKRQHIRPDRRKKQTEMKEKQKSAATAVDSENEVSEMSVDSENRLSEMYKNIFTMLDVDNSKSLDETELGTALRLAGHDRSDQEIGDLLVQFDADGNGELSEEEFIQMLKDGAMDADVGQIRNGDMFEGVYEAMWKKIEGAFLDEAIDLNTLMNVMDFQLSVTLAPSDLRPLFVEGAAPIGPATFATLCSDLIDEHPEIAEQSGLIRALEEMDGEGLSTECKTSGASMSEATEPLTQKVFTVASDDTVDGALSQETLLSKLAVLGDYDKLTDDVGQFFLWFAPSGSITPGNLDLLFKFIDPGSPSAPIKEECHRIIQAQKTRPVEFQAMRKLFNQTLPLDGPREHASSFLSLEALRTALMKLGEDCPESDLTAAFNRFDITGDGLLSVYEFATMMQTLHDDADNTSTATASSDVDVEAGGIPWNLVRSGHPSLSGTAETATVDVNNDGEKLPEDGGSVNALAAHPDKRERTTFAAINSFSMQFKNYEILGIAHDYYLPELLSDFCLLVIAWVGYNNGFLSEEARNTQKLMGTESTLSASLTPAQLAWILTHLSIVMLGRAIFSARWMRLKVAYHFTRTILHHVIVFVILPIHTGIPFHENTYAIWYYCLGLLGLIASAEQIHSGYGHFDIIFDPYPTHHQLFTALCAPCDMLYLVTIVIGC